MPDVQTSETMPETATPTVRLWGGRFADGPAPEMDRLNRSLPVDWRLWREDVAGSRAWAGALAAAGVISFAECGELTAGLSHVAARLSTWGEDDWAAAPDEDIHTLVERLLYQTVNAGIEFFRQILR